MAAAEEVSFWGRAGYLRATMKNWPLVFVDKLGLRRLIRYRTRTGVVVWCRGRATDVNEAVAVLSGLEYPFPYAMLNDGAFVVDAGANIGSFVLLLQMLNRTITFGGVAIEPFGETLAVLQRNLTANHVDRFTVVQGVVSDVDGSARIRTDVSPDRVHISNSGLGVEVSSFRLSTYCDQNDVDMIDLLKMDIEGAEYRVIESDYEFLRARVARALIEYHESDKPDGLQWLFRRLEADFAVNIVHSGAASGVVHAQNKRFPTAMTIAHRTAGSPT